MISGPAVATRVGEHRVNSTSFEPWKSAPSCLMPRHSTSTPRRCIRHPCTPEGSRLLSMSTRPLLFQFLTSFNSLPFTALMFDLHRFLQHLDEGGLSCSRRRKRSSLIRIRNQLDGRRRHRCCGGLGRCGRRFLWLWRAVESLD